VVVICPKCKTRLKVDENKIKPEGSRFKCPKCSAVLLVKKPVPRPKKKLDKNKILVAHANASTTNEITSVLKQNGFHTVTSVDGIDAMVKATQELPFLAIVDVGLPKIFGFEVCKRLKKGADTKEIKFILIGSIHDRKRYMREPESLYGADDYVDEQSVTENLMEKVNRLKGVKIEEKPEKKIERPPERPRVEKPEQKGAPDIKPQATTLKPAADDMIERARRLSRAIVSDIYLYNTAKANESIMNDTFYSVFENEIKEGLKLYENRISEKIRAQGDYFREAIDNFIESKKKSL
jgi:predicted Zn finger-like uncharacterized protein